MASSRPRTALSGEQITARTPIVLRLMAKVLEASAAGDDGYQLEAPSDLPMDEATFVVMLLLLIDQAESTGADPDELRAIADRLEAAGGGQ